MSAEAPILASGVLVLAGGYAREGHWPKNGTKAVVAIILLTFVAAAAGRTKGAGFVHALGWLFLISTAVVTVPFFGQHNTKKGKA